MQLSSPLAAGRTAQVFALDERRVLRRYVGGEDATAEAAVMAYVHAHGYPVPAIESASGPDIVMARVDGATMLELFLDGSLEPSAAGATLGDLHRRLHEIAPRPGCPPDERLLHLDLHPGNVMVDSSGPIVIDWCNARNGPPDLDIAVSALIVGVVVAADVEPLAAGARALLTSYLAAAGGHPERQLDAAVGLRSADPHLEPAEIALLDDAAALVRKALA